MSHVWWRIEWVNIGFVGALDADLKEKEGMNIKLLFILFRALSVDFSCR
jgi:hypothetical protein